MTNPWRDPEHGRRFPDGATEANPSREEQIDVLMALAAAHRVMDPDGRDLRPPRRILDAGCGKGYVAERLLAIHPNVTIVGFDFSAEMVAEARRRLGGRARIVRASFEDDWAAAIGERDFDLAVCVQALHHVPDATKRIAHRRFLDLLSPGGLYLQSDPVALGDASLFPYWKAIWNRLRSLRQYPPLGDSYLQGDAEEDFEKRGDLLASLDKQLAWLKEAGFAAVDCFWKHGNRAIFGGRRLP